MNAVTPFDAVVDVLIVGAGISGIGFAVHLSSKHPQKSFVILDRRAQPGGTWDLFRYPGIRSDSDMHTLGFAFAPWKHEKAIADGPAILDYLNEITDAHGLRPHMRFDHKVTSAAFDSSSGLWTVTAETAAGETRRLQARFVFMGAGYYDYDTPHDAAFAGADVFKGRIVHPQFWPSDLDYQNKNVVVIGSGATAVTIVPAMADSGAGHVTMLQRTPTWMISRPAKNGLANFMRKVMPETVAYAITRKINIFLQDLMFKRARHQPEKVKAALEKHLREILGAHFDPEAFTPPYNPWEQRLCLVPDSDFFNAIKRGKAGVVTDHIERFDETGVVLKSGNHLDADIIVTATGLKLAVAGKIAVSVDGAPVDFATRFYYRNCMFSNVPNFALVFGYLNASWTLRVDIIAEYLCRLFSEMDRKGVQVATPVMTEAGAPEEDDIFDFSSGYIQRSKHLLPKNAKTLPWRLNQDYRRDKEDMRSAPIDDGVIQFSKARVEAE